MKKEKKTNGNRLNLIICGIAFVVMLIYLFVFDKPEEVLKALRSLNPLYFCVCVAFMAGYWFCESATVHSILKGLHPQAKFSNTFTNTIIGQYFNCITPSASGGQPMQAYYFVKMGVPLSAGLTALFSRFIVYQFVLTIYSIVTLCIGFGQFGAELSSKGLMPFVFIGFGVNTIVIIFLLGIALWKSGTAKVINFFITLLTKMKIIKHPMKYRVIVSREINKFNNNFKFLKKNVPIIIKSCIFTTLQLTIYLSISYVLYKAFGLDGTGLLKVIFVCAASRSDGRRGNRIYGIFQGYFRRIYRRFYNALENTYILSAHNCGNGVYANAEKARNRSADRGRYQE